MKERPILFSGEMVRAILDGRKTQTRRVIKPQPDDAWLDWIIGNNQTNSIIPEYGIVPFRGDKEILCRYGRERGDLLWVRENFWIEHDSDMSSYDWGQPVDCGINLIEDDWAKVWYCASEDAPDGKVQFYSKRPSIHMPRWASRITLEITDIKVERLQGISCEDIIAEGLSTNLREYDAFCDLNAQFIDLWNRINTKRGFGWETNPWCWAISFRRIKP